MFFVQWMQYLCDSHVDQMNAQDPVGCGLHAEGRGKKPVSLEYGRIVVIVSLMGRTHDLQLGHDLHAQVIMWWEVTVADHCQPGAARNRCTLGNGLARPQIRSCCYGAHDKPAPALPEF